MTHTRTIPGRWWTPSRGYIRLRTRFMLNSLNVFCCRFGNLNEKQNPSLLPKSLLRERSAALCAIPLSDGSAFFHPAKTCKFKYTGGGTSLIALLKANLKRGWYLSTKGNFNFCIGSRRDPETDCQLLRTSIVEGCEPACLYLSIKVLTAWGLPPDKVWTLYATDFGHDLCMAG
jgi:hypothetical protein